MTVNELIERLRKFNPDGSAEVVSHYEESDEGYNDAINYLSMSEKADGKLVVIIHTDDNY